MECMKDLKNMYQIKRHENQEELFIISYIKSTF